MINSSYDWQSGIKKYSEQAVTISQQFNISPLVAEILIKRGYDNDEDIQAFLNPDETAFNDPTLMHDMDKAVERIQTAVMQEELITVYGDYDADGITSTTIVYETLSAIGANVNYYIPNRFTEGYGPNEAAFQKLIDAGTKLIVTVDNGIAGNSSIELAQSQGVDVIVTDHHEMPEVLPEAYALVHPRIGDSYHFPYLSGAGVAFKLVWALTEEFPAELIELAAIGTVADIVSLTGENRAIVKAGIQYLRQTIRPGLLALFKQAKLNIDNLDEEDIGFTIAPRLNSLGRMDEATPGVELLTTLDEDQAKQLAKSTEAANDQRKELVDQVTQQAIETVNTNEQFANHKVLVVVGQDWHPGVLGIAASRLVERYQRPVVVLSYASGEAVAKGSGRSIEQFDLFKGIDPIRDDLVAFGGHHSAVGLSVKVDQIEHLQQQLDQAIKEQQVNLLLKPQLQIAAQVSVDELTVEFYNDLQRLAPFGEDNPKPYLEIIYQGMSDVQLIGKTKNHLKFNLKGQHRTISALDFGTGNIISELTDSKLQTRVVGQLGTNTWRGKTNLQLMITDIMQTKSPVIDLRTSGLHQQMFQANGTYVFFHEKIKKQLLPYVNTHSTAVMFDQFDHEMDDTQIYLVDCPDTIADLTMVLNNHKPEQITFYLYKKTLVSKIGMPDRNQYATLFKFIKTHQNINLTTDLVVLAKQLQISENILIFIIQVFWELNFITINDKIVNVNPSYQKQQLESAPSYQLRLHQIETENELLNTDTKELIDFISNNIAN
ncbi:single-stranded-DNA-specific exonuclease RecJ [Lentilactobacillus kribbianus]|uniref:single-stranded-DNA-specific exonuclease RecJ n=1 Tax=Lentilactobacillus kribbianus TaxID=2729622 RepID=UPI0015579488|nr:single-stranded-DNA-specific exonuclease RecJ [Lentilactobacillus kribbianus]